MQTVWTDDLAASDDEEETQNNFRKFGDDFLLTGSPHSLENVADDDYDDPSHEIAIHIEAAEDDDVTHARHGRRVSTEDLYCDDEFQTNLVNLFCLTRQYLKVLNS